MGRHTAVWLGKRVLQKLGVRHRTDSPAPFAESADLPPIDTLALGPAMSSCARRLLAGALTRLDEVARRRQRNQMLWDASLAGSAAAARPAERPLNREWTPYLAAYEADCGTAEELFRQWGSRGLPVMTWPDLAPEVKARREGHPNAWGLRHSRVYLPVHQSLHTTEVTALAASIDSASGSEKSLELVWNVATPSQWEQLMTQAGRSNLLQSWSYGAAKVEDTGWRVERGVFLLENEPVALVQVLQKTFVGLLTVSRVNRGPLFVRECALEEQQAVWRELAKLGDIRRRRVCSIAPNLRLSGQSMAMTTELGFRQFSACGWESVWVDLGDSLESLRKRLHGKWRNMLNFAEKAGVQLEVSGGDDRFEWLMQRYEELMKERGFSGPPITLLRALRRHQEPDGSVIVLRALKDDDPVAGVCVVRHGATATYLVGWNGHAGRNLKAHQYLLWQAITHLKEAGVRWFDLGGIDEERTPTVTSFKLGMNGERYELVGEYWKW